MQDLPYVIFPSDFTSKIRYVFILSYAFHSLRPSDLPLFDCPNIRPIFQAIQIMKLHTMKGGTK